MLSEYRFKNVINCYVFVAYWTTFTINKSLSIAGPTINIWNFFNSIIVLSEVIAIRPDSKK